MKDLIQLILEKNVLTLLPHYNGVHSSIVYTHQRDLCLVETVDEIMDHICSHFCSDLDGRLNGSRKKFQFTKNPPILISEILALVAFQLPSPISGEKMWVFSQDFDIVEIEPSKCKIIFANKLSFDIPLSRKAIENKRMRAIQISHEFTYSVGSLHRFVKRLKPNN